MSLLLGGNTCKCRLEGPLLSAADVVPGVQPGREPGGAIQGAGVAAQVPDALHHLLPRRHRLPGAAQQALHVNFQYILRCRGTHAVASVVPGGTARCDSSEVHWTAVSCWRGRHQQDVQCMLIA